MEEERIQKLLARAGYGSRRQIERWIEKGAVMVNGKVATLGQKITDQSDVILRGQKLRLSTKLNAAPVVLLYHKQVGEICTRDDPEGRNTVFENLPEINPGRWISIGRLDINTDGLILFTNDGALANKLMHPSSEIEREYAVRVLGEVSKDMLKTLQNGVMLEDGMASFDNIRFAGGEGANQWYHVTLKEGRNREVRRLWESQGVTVSRLRRVRFGSISLDRSLRAGQFEELPIKRMMTLYESVGLELVVPEGAEPSWQRKENEKKGRGKKTGSWDSANKGNRRAGNDKSSYSKTKERGKKKGKSKSNNNSPWGDRG